MHTPASSGRPTRYDERLWPGPGGWALVVVFAATLGAALLPVGYVAAAVTGAVALVVGLVLAVSTTPRVEVSDGTLAAGTARIPLGLLGPATTLDRAGVRRAMGPELDARAFVCLRSWVGGAIRVEVVDPADPTPYWIVSSRRPSALVAALAQAQERPTARS